MRHNVLNRLILCTFCLIVIFAYTGQIIPHIVKNFFQADFQQDYLGALALLNRDRELYPVLGPAFAQMGLDWNVLHKSTHPPTAYLLVLPFTLLQHRSAQLAWMAVMFVCIIFTARVLGLPWKSSILASVLSLTWPPAFFSLFQFTPIWLLGLALAYRSRRHGLESGIYIALASLPKFLAAPAMLYHVRRRQWSALISFSAFWLGSLFFLLVLRPDAIAAYYGSNIGNSMNQIYRSDNGALLVVAWRYGGWIGLTAVVVLVLWVFWAALQRDGAAEWSCLVWLGIAILPIAWNYSILPLLPWLIIVVLSSSVGTRILGLSALLLPYASSLPGGNSTAVALSIALSGITFAMASAKEMRETIDNFETWGARF